MDTLKIFTCDCGYEIEASDIKQSTIVPPYVLIECPKCKSKMCFELPENEQRFIIVKIKDIGIKSAKLEVEFGFYNEFNLNTFSNGIIGLWKDIKNKPNIIGALKFANNQLRVCRRELRENQIELKHMKDSYSNLHRLSKKLQQKAKSAECPQCGYIFDMSIKARD